MYFLIADLKNKYVIQLADQHHSVLGIKKTAEKNSTVFKIIVRNLYFKTNNYFSVTNALIFNTAVLGSVFAVMVTVLFCSFNCPTLG
jgi:hypothetical protein